MWCDGFGNFIRPDITLDGCVHDGELFNMSMSVRTPARCFSEGEAVIGDTGFQGSGAIELPFEKGQGSGYECRTAHNKDIHKQRIINRWGTGVINKKWIFFLGRWALDEDLFYEGFEVGAMVVQWMWNLNSTELV